MVLQAGEAVRSGAALIDGVKMRVLQGDGGLGGEYYRGFLILLGKTAALGAIQLQDADHSLAMRQRDEQKRVRGCEQAVLQEDRDLRV